MAQAIDQQRHDDASEQQQRQRNPPGLAALDRLWQPATEPPPRAQIEQAIGDDHDADLSSGAYQAEPVVLTRPECVGDPRDHRRVDGVTERATVSTWQQRRANDRGYDARGDVAPHPRRQVALLRAIETSRLRIAQLVNVSPLKHRELLLSMLPLPLMSSASPTHEPRLSHS